MKRPTRIALKTLAALMVLVGVLGILGVWPTLPRVERVVLPPEPPPSSLPLPSAHPSDLGMGKITEAVIRDDDLFWFLVAGVGLIVVAVVGLRRADPVP